MKTAIADRQMENANALRELRLALRLAVDDGTVDDMLLAAIEGQRKLLVAETSVLKPLFELESTEREEELTARVEALQEAAHAGRTVVATAKGPAGPPTATR